MDVWNTYKARVEQSGADRRTHDLKYARAHFRHKLLNSLSYHTVLIEGREQGVVILNKADMSEKKINALPGERLVHGGYVDYEGSKWLITEVDASNEVYESGIMLRCNHLLKWLDERGKIIEKWCIVEDGTKYLIGEKAKNIMTIGDARIAVTVPKDKDTIMLGRGRRFLIDDADSKEVLAYEITKSNRLYNNYNDQGVFRYILNEVNATDNDNMELRIADYYNWKPAAKHDSDHREQDTTLEEIVEDAKEKAGRPPDDEKEVWI